MLTPAFRALPAAILPGFFLAEGIVHRVFGTEELGRQPDVAAADAGFVSGVVGVGDREILHGCDSGVGEFHVSRDRAFGNFGAVVSDEAGGPAPYVGRGDGQFPDLFNAGFGKGDPTGDLPPL